MLNGFRAIISAHWDSKVETDRDAVHWMVPLRQNMPKHAKDELLAAYGTKTCVVTRACMPIDWTHLSPHSDHVRICMIAYLQSLHLLPPNCDLYSPLLVLPLDLERNLHFENLALAIFPSESTLRHYIGFEEEWFAYRTRSYEAYGVDIGRPPYESASGLSTFDIFFSPTISVESIRINSYGPYGKGSALFDPAKESLSRNLPLSVPAVVHTGLARMARLAPSPRTDRLIRWALYLSALWTRKLGCRPDVPRPVELAFSLPRYFTNICLGAIYTPTPRPNSPPYYFDIENEPLFPKIVDEDEDEFAEGRDPETISESIEVYGNGKEAIKAHIDVIIGVRPQTVLFRVLPWDQGLLVN